MTAGLFAGEITQNAPLDEAPTTKPRAYVWMEYGTPIIEVLPFSREGYAVTQENWFGSDPNFTHPFANEVWDAITMTAVFRPKDVISNTNDQGIYNIRAAGPVNLYIRKRPITDETTFGYSIVSDGGINISSGLHEITLDQPGWSDDDWFWMGVSYSNTLNEVTFAVVDFNLGLEMVTPVTVTTNQQLSFGPSLTSSSIVVWGANSSGGVDVQGSAFPGPMSQVFIHNAYKDFADPFVRRQFAALNGIIDVGPTGNYPFGVTPLVYMPRGWPEGNLGTTFIGNSSDFWLEDIVSTDTDLPPVGS